MNLLVQGMDVETGDLKKLAKLSGARDIQQVASNVFRLRDAHSTGAGTTHDGNRKAEIASFCEQAQLDYAYVPESRRLSDFRLLVMDMDSTLITIETIDELADLVGLKREVAAVTEQAMRGEIEYNESLERRVAVLKDLPEEALSRVYAERVKLTPGADQLLARAQAVGIKTLLVSGGFTYVTERLKARLKLDYTRSNCLEMIEGKLTGRIVGHIVNADVKRDALIEVRDELGCVREQIIGIGDGANDLKFMAECGVSIAYHAKPIVRGQTTHALNHVDLKGVLPLFNESYA